MKGKEQRCIVNVYREEVASEVEAVKITIKLYIFVLLSEVDVVVVILLGISKLPRILLFGFSP